MFSQPWYALFVKTLTIYDDQAGQLPRIYGCDSIFIYLYRTFSARPVKFLVKFKSWNVSTTNLKAFRAYTQRKLA